MSAAKKKPTTRKPTPKKPAAKKPAPRADYGEPIDGFFAKQPAALRPTLEALRALVEKAAPDATSTIKWGMPFYSIGAGTMCALTAHKAHVNLVLSGPPETFPDPDGRLTGDGKTGRRLALAAGDPIPTAQVRKWLAAAAARARAS
jgi:hypothetical protein